LILCEHIGLPETVAVIGTGDMGDSLGPLFAKQGHRVVYGSRHPDSERAMALVTRTGNSASTTTQSPADWAACIP